MPALRAERGGQELTITGADHFISHYGLGRRKAHPKSPWFSIVVIWHRKGLEKNSLLFVILAYLTPLDMIKLKFSNKSWSFD